MRTSGCFLLALCVGNSIASISWKTPVYRSDSIPTNGGLGGPTGLRVDTFQPNRYTPGNVGVCFSGGGSIALAETMGRLRALKYLGLIDKVKSISSVSGGTWATAPFTFLPDTIDDDEFLGTMTTDPSKLSLTSLFNGDQSTVLSYVSSNNLGFVPTQPGMKIAALVLQIPELLALGIPENRMWTHLMGEYVLKPFGLSEFGSDHCPTHSFCADAAQCAEVSAANPNVPLRGMRAGRPFHIMNSAMFVRANEEPSSNTFDYLAPIHATPWRMGIASSPAATFNDNGEQVPVGGGTIGSHAFNSKISAIDSQGDISVDQPCPFGLSDITGMSSAAPAELAKNQYPVFAGVDPQYSYFPIQGASVGSGSVTKFSDGGTVDNTGILGTLQYEDIDTVMSFVYTQVSIHKTADGTIVIDGSYPSLFGYQQWTAQRGWELYPATDVPLEVNNLNTEFRFNQVFESSAFADLLQGLYDASTNNGQDPVGTASPVFLQKNLKVLPNSWWGIKGGRTVNVLWTYSDMVEDWRTQLPFTVQADLKLKPNFPHINFLETGIDAVTVNELAQLSSWVLYDRRAAYEALFDPVALANYDASTDSTRTRRHHGSSVSAAGVAIASVLVAAAFTVAIVAVVVARRRRAWRQKEQMSVPLLTVPSMA